MLQQIEQFQLLGDDFATQYQGIDEMGKVSEEMVLSFLEKLPVERRLQGLSPEEILPSFSPQQIVDGLDEKQQNELLALMQQSPKKKRAKKTKRKS